MEVARVALVDVAAVGMGIATGVWASLMTADTCGPVQLCAAFLAQRFAVWQSVLIGLAAMTLLLVAGATVSAEFRRTNLVAARSLQRWLFEDLTESARR